MVAVDDATTAAPGQLVTAEEAVQQRMAVPLAEVGRISRSRAPVVLVLTLRACAQRRLRSGSPSGAGRPPAPRSFK